MSGVFTTIFNPGLSVSNGSDDQSTASGGSYAPDESGHETEDAQQAGSGGSSTQEAAADAEVDLGLEVTLSNEVEMSWADDQGNVQTYSRSDEVALDVDAANTLNGLLTNEDSYADTSDYTA
jgi:hypothetical protein